MEHALLYNTFNRLCKYLENNNCSRVFLIEHNTIMFKINKKIFPNNICYSYNWYNWFDITKTPDIQTQLKYFLLPLNNRFFQYLCIHVIVQIACLVIWYR